MPPPIETIEDIVAQIIAKNPLDEFCRNSGIMLKREGLLLVGLCPFHEEKTPSFKIFPDHHFHCFGTCNKTGNVIHLYRHLHGECSFRDACLHFGYDISQVDEIIATYPYHDESGAPLYEIVRKYPKQFLVRHEVNGHWVWSKTGVRIVPYHLDEVVAAEHEIFICEGEKDCETLRKLHLVATCNPFGGENWRDEFAPYFQGKSVYICPDSDEKGQKHCLQVGRNLLPVAKDLSVLSLPKGFKDVTELFENDRVSFEERLKVATLRALPFADFQANGEHPAEGGKPADQPKASFLFDFRNLEPKRENTLLGNRFLCRGGGMLFVGPSGMGKSSASVQQDIEWCMGRPSFGIKPGKALKIVTIQAEDDEEDISEMVKGVCKFLEITPEQQKEARERCIYIPCKSLTGSSFISFVRKILEEHKPDLLRINPLQAYIGADIKDPEKTAAFLRNGLNPLLEEFNCAVIIVHHTPKTNFRDTEEWKASDWMYAGAGSADITNWARAILIADPTDDPNVFAWIAAKRGKRIGWSDKEGNPTTTRHFSHSASNGIHWDDTEPIDIPEKKLKAARKANASEALELMPPTPLDVYRPEFASTLQDKLGVGVNKSKELIAIMLETNQVILVKKPRSGTKPAEYLQRSTREINTGDQHPISISQR